LGMNEEEWKKNPRLDEYVVQNLNRAPGLPFGDAEFDGCGICVSIDYLTRPVEVLREVGRVSRVGAPTISPSPIVASLPKPLPSGTNWMTRDTCNLWSAICETWATSATSAA
jgi:ubiquinone/menaquinone biosynthesis C-methylase UbiE